MIARVQNLALGYPEGRLELQLIGGYKDNPSGGGYSEDLFYNIMRKLNNFFNFATKWLTKISTGRRNAESQVFRSKFLNENVAGGWGVLLEGEFPPGAALLFARKSTHNQTVHSPNNKKQTRKKHFKKNLSKLLAFQHRQKLN